MDLLDEIILELDKKMKIKSVSKNCNYKKGNTFSLTNIGYRVPLPEKGVVEYTYKQNKYKMSKKGDKIYIIITDRSQHCKIIHDIRNDLTGLMDLHDPEKNKLIAKITNGLEMLKM